MKYDGDIKIPADAQAVIISPSIVGDRYVQLTPVYDGGDVLEDNVSLDESRTAVPLELDQIYSSLDRLTVALGPNGANANGALTDLLESTAANFGGQGAKFRQTIADFSTLSETLDDNKEELFGSLAELEGFVSTLADNDDTVRKFNQSLADVSTMLSGESDELSAALANLSTALGQVGTFVAGEQGLAGPQHHRPQPGRQGPGEAPAPSSTRSSGSRRSRSTNLALTYNPDTGTLDTNANLGNLAHEIQSNPGPPPLLAGQRQRPAGHHLRPDPGPAAGHRAPPRAAFGDSGKPTAPEAGLPQQVRPLPERSGGRSDDAQEARRGRRPADQLGRAERLRLRRLPAAAARRHRRRRRPDEHHRRVPRRARPGAAVDGQGQRRQRRQGHRRRARRLHREGHRSSCRRTPSSRTTRSRRSARPACWARSSSPSRRRAEGASTDELGRRRHRSRSSARAATPRSRRCWAP